MHQGPLHPYVLMGTEALLEMKEEDPPAGMAARFTSAWQRGDSERRKFRYYLRNRDRWRAAVAKYLDGQSPPVAPDGLPVLTGPHAFGTVFPAVPERSLSLMTSVTLPYPTFLVAQELHWPSSSLDAVEVKVWVVVAPPEALSVISSEPLFSPGWFMTHPQVLDVCAAAEATGHHAPLLLDASAWVSNPGLTCGEAFRASRRALQNRITRRMKSCGATLSFLHRHQTAVLLGSAGRPGRFHRVVGDLEASLLNSAGRQAVAAFAAGHLLSPLRHEEIQRLADTSGVLVEVSHG